MIQESLIFMKIRQISSMTPARDPKQLSSTVRFDNPSMLHRTYTLHFDDCCTLWTPPLSILTTLPCYTAMSDLDLRNCRQFRERLCTPLERNARRRTDDSCLTPHWVKMSQDPYSQKLFGELFAQVLLVIPTIL